MSRIQNAGVIARRFLRRMILPLFVVVALVIFVFDPGSYEVRSYYPVEQTPEDRSYSPQQQTPEDRWYNPSEQAPWFGKTGINIDDEKELTPYLRRELGQTTTSLKASDLVYDGVFKEGTDTTRYWTIPLKVTHEKAWAVITTHPDGSFVYAWGLKPPPALGGAEVVGRAK